MTDDEQHILKKILQFLRKHQDEEFFPDEIAKKTKEDQVETASVIDNARINNWVDVDHFNDAGIPAVRINPFGNKKLNQISDSNYTTPYSSIHDSKYRIGSLRISKKRLTGLIIATIFFLLSPFWSSFITSYFPEYVPTPIHITNQTSEITQDIKKEDKQISSTTFVEPELESNDLVSKEDGVYYGDVDLAHVPNSFKTHSQGNSLYTTTINISKNGFTVIGKFCTELEIIFPNEKNVKLEKCFPEDEGTSQEFIANYEPILLDQLGQYSFIHTIDWKHQVKETIEGNNMYQVHKSIR